jgi:nucleoside-diphosphate-sugar epimerase
LDDTSASAPVRRILVTGISGNLGRRLAPLLAGFEIVSADLHPPPPETTAGRFVQLDLSKTAGQQRLTEVIEREQVEAVLHLAFVIDPVRTGIVDVQRMWRANVAATQHLLDSIARLNRERTQVRLFVFPSSVSAYGPDLPETVGEDAPLRAHTLPYAVHKRECDEICRRMHPHLGGCAVYVFRPHIFAGRTMDNFILRSFRGRPSGRGWLARLYERRGWRVPILLPRDATGENRFQFVHVDDVARVLLWTLTHWRPRALRIFNLAGWGDPLTLAECANLFGTPVLRLPSERWVRLWLRLFWWLGLSGVPPETLPYFLGTYMMEISRLERELGPAFKEIVQFSSRDALLDSRAG